MKLANEKLLIIRKFKLFILNIEKLLLTIPKKDYISRELLYKECMLILELIYYANCVDDLVKKKELQYQVIAKINLVDFYLERCFRLKYISLKALIKETNEIITKMIYGWIKSE